MTGLRIAFAALLALWLSLAAAFAYDPAVIGQAERALAGFQTDIASVANDLRNPALSDKQLTDLRTRLEAIRAGAADQSLQLDGPIAEVNQQIASLGPPPAEGKAEPEGVANARSDLQASLDRLRSVKGQLDVIAVDAEQQAGRVAALQRDQFFQRIFESGRSILNPLLWYDTTLGTGTYLNRIGGLLSAWWRDTASAGNPLGLLLAPLFVGLFIGAYAMLKRWLARWTDSYSAANRAPDDISRLWRIARGVVTAFVAILILTAPIMFAFEYAGYATPRFTMLMHAVMGTIAGTFLYTVFVRRIAAPGLANWRVIDIDDGAASRLSILASIAAFLAVADLQISILSDGLYMPVSFSIGQSAIFALALLITMSLIILTLRGQSGLANPSGRRFYLGWAAGFAPVAWVLIIFGLGALLLGYLALASYIARGLFRTSMLVTALFLLHHLSDAAVAAAFDSQSGFGRFFRRATGIGERAIERLGLIFRTVVDLLLVIIGIPLLLLLWTVTWVDLGSLLTTVAMGIRLGEITLSPGTILTAIAILAGGVIFTKLFVSWLDRRILAETRINRGVQDSISKGASYAGYIMAAGFALTAAGLDFSNLAIIAGALGLGIGLGLQTIVNNFVSGLILLAERPIRVGDWVSLAVGEGVVRRINVRSTEIETFDSCSIIVPNSSLVVEPVKNWTHHDTLGRFMVAVTVDYASDPEQVRKLLIEAAREHPKVLSAPEPVVTLVRFGATGLDFELRAFVADVFGAGLTASDIRFELLKLFREKNITIPLPVTVMQAPGR